MTERTGTEGGAAAETRGPRGIIITAPASGSGKTVVTLGIGRALRRRGLVVAPAKTGPDYIDPAFHGVATGVPCVSLDTWAMRPGTLAGVIASLSGDIALAEGVMGLFDGADCGEPGDGSTASLAALTGWPVILVQDVTGQGASAAAVARGFAMHRADVRLAGVILNRVGGPRHAASLRRAFAEALPEVPVLGCLPRDATLSLPHRHLGLVQAGEQSGLDSILEAAADLVDAHIDLDAVLTAARPARIGLPSSSSRLLPPLGQRIAVATDIAFAFTYPAQLAAWQQAGAEVLPFSPLANQAPDAAADAVYLPGGYPELHAGVLAAAGRFLGGLRDAAARGAVIYGECGGYMTLGRALIDANGIPHALAGLLPLVTSFEKRRLHLGYRQAECLTDGPFGPTGTRLRGHEFHYATIVEEGSADRLFTVTDAGGQTLGEMGLRRGRVGGSFLHGIDLG